VSGRFCARAQKPAGSVMSRNSRTARSGASETTTPIDAQPTSTGVLIPLVYGAQAEWCSNILAAGGCTLKLAGKDFELRDPRVTSFGVAEPQLSAEKRGPGAALVSSTYCR